MMSFKKLSYTDQVVYVDHIIHDEHQSLPYETWLDIGKWVSTYSYSLTMRSFLKRCPYEQALEPVISKLLHIYQYGNVPSEVVGFITENFVRLHTQSIFNSSLRGDWYFVEKFGHLLIEHDPTLVKVLKPEVRGYIVRHLTLDVVLQHIHMFVNDCFFYCNYMHLSNSTEEASIQFSRRLEELITLDVVLAHPNIIVFLTRYKFFDRIAMELISMRHESVVDFGWNMVDYMVETFSIEDVRRYGPRFVARYATDYSFVKKFAWRLVAEPNFGDVEYMKYFQPHTNEMLLFLSFLFRNVPFGVAFAADKGNVVFYRDYLRENPQVALDALFTGASLDDMGYSSISKFVHGNQLDRSVFERWSNIDISV